MRRTCDQPGKPDDGREKNCRPSSLFGCEAPHGSHRRHEPFGEEQMNSPESTLSSREVAETLRVTLRQAQRVIASGRLGSVQRTGRARVTRLALWRYLGVEAEMMRLWLDHLDRRAAADTEATKTTD